MLTSKSIHLINDVKNKNHSTKIFSMKLSIYINKSKCTKRTKNSQLQKCQKSNTQTWCNK